MTLVLCLCRRFAWEYTPVITSLGTTSGWAGTVMDISGENLQDITDVRFMSAKDSRISSTVRVTSASAASVGVTVPALAPGKYLVQLFTASAERSVNRRTVRRGWAGQDVACP